MVLHDHMFWLFALYERKKPKREKEKYCGSRARRGAAACPEALLSSSKGLTKGRQNNGAPGRKTPTAYVLSICKAGDRYGRHSESCHHERHRQILSRCCCP